VQGRVLNQISAFWFKRFGEIRESTSSPLISKSSQRILQPSREQLAGRSMIVKKTKPLAGGMRRARVSRWVRWKRYQESQSVCRNQTSIRTEQASQLPEPIFTPATTAERSLTKTSI